MYPILIVTGATCTGKTAIAIEAAKQVGATILPLDQLQRYQYLEEGVGYNPNRFLQVKTEGYAILSPWEVSPPHFYVQWLENKVESLIDKAPIIIEGGCTSYLAEILKCMSSNSVLSLASICILENNNQTVVIDSINQACSIEKFRAIVRETDFLVSKGFIKQDGLEFLKECENTFVHPQYDDTRLAWAIRISAKVYCPAYLSLLGHLDMSQGRERMIENAIAIHFYQQKRIQGFMEEYKRGDFFGSTDSKKLQKYLKDIF